MLKDHFGKGILEMHYVGHFIFNDNKKDNVTTP
jgi:hypothetical protein